MAVITGIQPTYREQVSHGATCLCDDCGLPIKPHRKKRGVKDSRPSCPFCGGSNLTRLGQRTKRTFFRRQSQ